MYRDIYTNIPEYGGNLKDQFTKDVSNSNGIHIASGYFGADFVSDFESKFVQIGRKGTCRLLFGMVYHKGVSKKQLDALKSLDNQLRLDNPENGVYISRKEYHGKIYRLESNQNENEKDKIYVGSSNFSSQGFNKRDECTIQVDNINTRTEISKYIDYLFNRSTTSPLKKVDLRRGNVTTSTGETLKDCEIDSSKYPHNKAVIGVCPIELRVDDQPASSLNLFFDKGRLNRSTGLYSPRPWYEVELTASSNEIRSEYYPESIINPNGNGRSRMGSFVAYANNGDKFYKIHMKVHADNGKNISSADKSGGRSTLGELIKGQLERAGVLKKNGKITSNTLSDYGKDHIKFNKIGKEEYIIEF